MIATTWCPDGELGELRLATFIRALKSWNRHLRYDGAIDLIVADDGTADDLWHRMIAVESVWKRGTFHVTREHRRGVGGSLNRAFTGLNEISLYAVDDWALFEPFDLNPWVQLLEERDDVGVVRLGPPHPGNMLRVDAWTDNWQGWAGEVLPSSWSIIVSERPALWHRRMIETYGLFKEECSALECEAEYDERYRAAVARGRWKKVLLALPHPWMHLNSSTLSEVEPRGR
jgi:hypothetical protein